MKRAALLLLLLVSGCGPTVRPTAHPGPLERNVKSGETVTFDGSESLGNITAYEWDFGDSAGIETGKVVTHVYAKDGNFSATLTVRGPGGIHSASVAVNVGAGCNAVAGIAVQTSNPQPGTPVRLISNGSRGCDGAALTGYAWEFGDGQTLSGDSTRSSVEHTWADAGTYNVALTVTDVKGNTGRATRSLGIGVAGGKPLVQCPATVNAAAGKPVTLSATASDPGAMSMTVTWVFGDGTPNGSGSSVQHTYATAGTVTATVTATTTDARTSDPCSTMVIVAPPPDYSGSWLLNPGAASLTGCSLFTVSFPAATMQVVHTGTSMSATPAGGTWPAGNSLTGMEDPPPAAPGTFRLRKTLPNETRGSCGVMIREESVDATFPTNTTVTGTWKILFTATACLGGGAGCVSANCNCVAQVGYSGVKQ